jgi:hypothetical protein
VDLIIGVATADRGAAIFATAAAPIGSKHQKNITSTEVYKHFSFFGVL